MTKTGRRAVVGSFTELARHPFDDGINALCWPRTLDGDFGEIARMLAPADGLVAVDAEMLHALPLSPAGRIAADAILGDMHLLDELGRDPVLNCVTRYERDERGLPITTDVLSFHADRAPVECDTWLCTYWGKSSEGIDNDDARRLIDDPGIRAAVAHVRDEAFDLHYGLVEGARPFAFGVGHLWRIAVAWPGSAVPPCLHRAPATQPGDEPRLLLIC
ncbi:MAG: hypothetical protein SFX73_35345 [Kofleriaceae bacterium]|nr:hypothetical protein [Kofleriaceae bacterium]